MHWSRRVPPDLTPTDLAADLAQAAAAPGVIDLTRSNPTEVGLSYPAALAQALGSTEVLHYRPDPHGPQRVRDTVAESLAGDGIDVDPRDLFLTASTSEAYGWLAKLWCNPGDIVAMSAPGYPLLATLWELEGVRVARFDWTYDGRWCVDWSRLKALLARGVRAVVLVNPNNPTGSMLTAEDARQLHWLCRSADVPLVVDEVFSPYRAPTEPSSCTTFLPRHQGLVVTLDGVSKRLGLPQMKVAWMRWSGDPTRVTQARSRLEWIADAYLSVSAPAALALPCWLSAGRVVTSALRDRIVRNEKHLEVAVSRRPEVSMLPRTGGWYAVLQIPHVCSEDKWVRTLAREHGVVVQPGFWYDFPRAAYLVVCLIEQTPRFAEGVERLRRGFTTVLSEMS